MAKSVIVSLREGIIKRFEYSALANECKMFSGRGPIDAVMPYVSIAAEFGPWGQGLAGKQWSDRTIQFSIFSADPDIIELDSIFEGLRELYHNQSFEIDKGHLVKMQFLNDVGPEQLPEDEGGWQWIMDFGCRVTTY